MPADSRTPSLIGEVIAKTMSARGLGALGELARLQRLWEKAVGEAVARHARPESLKGRTLTIAADSSAWMNQLSSLSPTIIGQVNDALGSEAVEELRFKMGGAAAPRKEPPAEVKAQARRRLTKEEKEEIEDALLPITDDALKAKARRLLSAALARKRP